MAIETFPEEEELIRHAKNALGVLNPSYYMSAPHFNPNTNANVSGGDDCNGGVAVGGSGTQTPSGNRSQNQTPNVPMLTSVSTNQLPTTKQQARMNSMNQTMGSASTPQSPVPKSKSSKGRRK